MGFVPELLSLDYCHFYGVSTQSVVLLCALPFLL